MAKKDFLLSMARVQSKVHKSYGIDDLMSFFQMLSTLLNAGTPLLPALRMAGEQSESEKLGKIVKDIANRVAAGETFNKAASAYPQIFETQWLQMIRTGELSGQLGRLMLKLNENIQQTRAMRTKVTSAMTYPTILLGVAGGSVYIMLSKVVPTFADFLKDFGSKLPPITQFVIDLSNFIQRRGLVIFGGLGLFVYLFRRYTKTEGGNRQFHAALMAVPVLGELVVQSAMEKFATNLSLLINSGTPLLDSIKATQEVFREDPIYAACLNSIYSGVSRGESLTHAMQSTGLFTGMMLSMAKIGEESGKLSEVLDQTAAYYREKVETLVVRFTGLLEPLIVIGMGVVVCGLLASIYIPMFQMAGGGSG
jgi:type IV pilus assembly protein PilC